MKITLSTHPQGRKAAAARRWRRIILQSRRATVLALLLLTCVGLGFVYSYQASVGPVLTRVLAGATGAEVAHIQVVGAVLTEKEDVADALGLTAGDSLVAFSTSKARQRLEALPWVRQASVERRLPDTIRVEIYEHKPLARVQEEGHIWVANKEGDLLVDVGDGEFDSLPFVSGMGAADEAAALFALLQHKPNLMVQLTEAHRVGERRWDLEFKSGVVVMLPEKNPQQALDWLQALEERRHVLTLVGGTVDLRLPDRITLKIPSGADAGVVLDQPSQQLAPGSRV